MIPFLPGMVAGFGLIMLCVSYMYLILDDFPHPVAFVTLVLGVAMFVGGVIISRNHPTPSDGSTARVEIKPLEIAVGSDIYTCTKK